MPVTTASTPALLKRAPFARATRVIRYKSIRDKEYNLVLYQAGADIHIDDPLGGLLTTEQMIFRDELVFRGCARFGIPIVWNLAGGYQRDADGGISQVLALHRNTMYQCIRARDCDHAIKDR